MSRPPNIDSCRACEHCNAVHGQLPKRVIPLTTIKTYTICRACRGIVNVEGHGHLTCKAKAEAYRMCSQGLIATNRGWIEPSNSMPGFAERYSCTSGAPYAAKILKAFDHEAHLVPSRYINTGNRNECWTTKAGMDLLLLIQNAARRFGSAVSTPDMARRFAANRDLFTEFRALWLLNASEKTLERLLVPMMKGPPTKPGALL